MVTTPDPQTRFAKLLALTARRLCRPSWHILGPRAAPLYIGIQTYLRKMSTPAPPPAYVIPEGFTLHKENTSAILLPASNDTFLNPVQEFNRDLSVACIRTWGDLMNAEKEGKWRASSERRAKRAEGQGAGGRKAKKAKSECRLFDCDVGDGDANRSVCLCIQADEDVQVPVKSEQKDTEIDNISAAELPSTDGAPKLEIIPEVRQAQSKNTRSR